MRRTLKRALQDLRRIAKPWRPAAMSMPLPGA